MRAPPCPPGFVGPTDKPSYFFMGLPRSPSTAPQGTPFSDIYAAAVTSSPELQQLGFTAQYSSLGSRLDAILGANPNGEGRIDRLVDLTVGMHPATAKGMERNPSIFYVDGYWRTDDSASGFAYNGRGTIVASKSVILSDSVLYLGDMSNVNADAPKTACASATDRGLCGAADMLGIIAQENIWIGDPNGQIHEVDAVMLAGRDINLVQYAALRRHLLRGVEPSADVQRNRAGAPRHGTGSGLGRPHAGAPGSGLQCRAASVPPRHVRPGRHELWRGGLLEVPQQGSRDRTLRRRYVRARVSGGVRDDPGPAADAAELPARESASDPLPRSSIKYDTRLHEHPELIPPGLPTRGLAAVLWKDCGSNPKCPRRPLRSTSILPEPIRIDDTFDAVICHTRPSGLL